MITIVANTKVWRDIADRTLLKMGHTWNSPAPTLDIKSSHPEVASDTKTPDQDTMLIDNSADAPVTAPTELYGIGEHKNMIVDTFSASSLATAENFASFIAAIQAPSGIDLCFYHSAAGVAHVDAAKLQSGINCYGADNCPAAELFRDGTFHQRSTETIFLNDAIFSPSSTVVCSTSRGLYDATLQNFLLVPGKLNGLVKNDGLYELDASGSCRFTTLIQKVPFIDLTAIPICGTGFHNYGHFLYDGLPAIVSLLASLEDKSVKIVGPKLAHWQSSVLSALGLLDRYLPLTHQTRFRKLIVTSLVSLHVSYPTRFIRPLFDTIIYKLGAVRAASDRRVWISRGGDITKRHLLNRAEVEACVQRFGFEIVMPETLSFEEQVRLFNSCVIVGGESGAGMANVGFCNPGTRVLELQPVEFVEGWTRAACVTFGLEWNVVFANPDPQPAALSNAQPPLQFLADISALSAALQRVTRPWLQ